MKEIFTIDDMIKEYNRNHTCWRLENIYRFEEYKERLAEFNKQKEEFFWDDRSIPRIDTEINYKIFDYKFEICRLKELWYRLYCRDLYRRSPRWWEF